MRFWPKEQKTERKLPILKHFCLHFLSEMVSCTAKKSQENLDQNWNIFFSYRTGYSFEIVYFLKWLQGAVKISELSWGLPFSQFHRRIFSWQLGKTDGFEGYFERVKCCGGQMNGFLQKALFSLPHPQRKHSPSLRNTFITVHSPTLQSVYT